MLLNQAINTQQTITNLFGSSPIAQLEPGNNDPDNDPPTPPTPPVPPAEPEEDVPPIEVQAVLADVPVQADLAVAQDVITDKEVETRPINVDCCF